MIKNLEVLWIWFNYGKSSGSCGDRTAAIESLQSRPKNERTSLPGESNKSYLATHSNSLIILKMIRCCLFLLNVWVVEATMAAVVWVLATAWKRKPYGLHLSAGNGNSKRWQILVCNIHVKSNSRFYRMLLPMMLIRTLAGDGVWSHKHKLHYCRVPPSCSR